MTRDELEMALLQIGKAVQTLVGAYRPDVDQIRVTVCDGQICAYACVYGDDGSNLEEVLDANAFPDGTVRFGRRYIFKDEEVSA